ncbi:T9SS type A sorting domain-containing protein [Hymenobacter sp. ISL-91]|uniref:T9SS type A sorting domain-containing protein n=1 Tax=Hymenobacter sp. ISL-91 TaxID=2819151 RepID=UPI001BE91B18|nr:T9SS type A sorting domain-containing protein [Hymenobacter sp. ISL-91]MBT2556815.1 T9SS type A sorting domain-containing protein [Hymenobacter sp. ISL-91]
MKKKYLRNSKAGSDGRLWALLALLWFAPLLGQAQTFTESMGNTATEGQSVASYTSALGFDNDNERGLSYLANGTDAPVLSLANPGGVSGGVNVLFPNSSSAANFFIRDISTAGFSSASLTFQLNAPINQIPGTNASATGRFRIAYSVGSVNDAGNDTYGNYVNLPYTYTAGSSGGWGAVTVDLPAAFVGNSLVALRFQRVGGATGDFRIDDVQLSGTTTPVVTGLPSNLDFDNVAVGSNSAIQNIRVSGQQLTGNLTVTAPAGYEIRVSGQFVQSISFAPINGVVPGTRVQVRFAPTAAGPNNASLIVSSLNADEVAIALTGNGTVPTLVASPASVDFGTTFVGQETPATSITVSGTNVVSPVTVTAPAGFSVRRTSADAYTQSIVLTAAEANAGFAFQARFNPATSGAYNAAIQITTPNASTSVAVQGQATVAPTGPFIVVSPTNLDFQTVSGSGSAQTLAFSINAGNLDDPLVLTGSNNNIVFRDASAGGDFVNGPITINPTDGTVSLREIEVRLVAPVPSGAFAGTITATSTGAAPKVVTIQANAIQGNSTINIEGVLAQFSTVPGIPSDVQSYFVTGTNLLQDLRIAAPQFFQVSLDPTFAGVVGTGNSFSITPSSSGEVPRTQVYVRFLPPSALTITDVIINSSSPATSQAVQANGTSEPSIQILNQFVEVRNVVINTTSASQAITINAKRVLQPITISKLLTPSSLNVNNEQQFQLSLDNVTFTNSIVLTPNSMTNEVNQEIFVRYRPTYLGTGQSTLRFQSNDFANQNTQSFGANDLLSGRSIDVEPTLRSAVNVTRNGATATVTFTLPANYAAIGYGEGRLIVASESATLPSTSQPADGTPYTTGNQTYGVGPQIAPGFFVVYSGANSSVIIDGLNPAVTYYFYTFEYNNIQNNLNIAVPGAENYLSPPTPNLIPGIEAPGEPPLPVTLVSFSAKASGSQVAIRWETASELNNKHFVVERSRDSRAFVPVITRAGQGTTNAATVYNEVDRQPLNGLSYYRLKQVDLDGKTSYSSIVAVSLLKAGEVVMYPNPVTDQLTITMNGGTEGVSATITDLSGRTIQVQQLRADGKLNVANLKAGTYLVTVGNGSAKVTRRIVKQ